MDKRDFIKTLTLGSISWSISSRDIPNWHNENDSGEHNQSRLYTTIGGTQETWLSHQIRFVFDNDHVHPNGIHDQDFELRLLSGNIS